jgi:hypothetical protein
VINPESAIESQALWTVGVPRQTTIQDGQRGYVPGWEIPVIMADKSSFTVSVPADQFTPENVKAVIDEHVDRLVQIRGLQGGSF